MGSKALIPLIFKISNDHKASIGSFVQSQLPKVGGPARAEVERAITSMYAHLRLEAPHIFWCRSPFQTAVMPFLLNVITTNGKPCTLSCEPGIKHHCFDAIKNLLTERLTNPAWRIALEDLIEQIPPTLEQPYGSAWKTLGSQQTITEQLRTSYFSMATDIQASLRQSFRPCQKHLNDIFRSTDRVLGRTWWQARDRVSEDFSGMSQDDLLSLAQGKPLFPSSLGLAASVLLQLGELLTLTILERLGKNNKSPSEPSIQGESILEWKLAQVLDESQVRLRWAAWAHTDLVNFQIPRLCIDSKVYSQDIKRRLSIWWDFKNAAPAMNAFADTVFVSDFPTAITCDARGLLHNLNEPALSFPDGYKAYSVHGISVEGAVVEQEGFLTVEKIEAERNVERRRAYIDIYGMSRYLADSHAVIVSQDEYGVLFRKEVTGDEPIVVVQVKNSTPEPDGTFKYYFLRVPPDTGTAREAVAWTFGLTKDEYHPTQET